MKGIFVTGTDTEVGKTCISASLLHWCNLRGLCSAGFKPVAAGATCLNGTWVNEDVIALGNASSLDLSAAEIGPYQFEDACAPHIAAALRGRTIDRRVVLQAAHTLSARADVLVVEGVGGFCVPLGPEWDSADLAADLNMSVVMVVGLRLGCINHALLTAQAVRARGLRLAGWVGNSIVPNMPWCTENIATMKNLLSSYQAPCLGVIPHVPDPIPSTISEYLDSVALHQILDGMGCTAAVQKLPNAALQNTESASHQSLLSN